MENIDTTTLRRYIDKAIKHNKIQILLNNIKGYKCSNPEDLAVYYIWKHGIYKKQYYYYELENYTKTCISIIFNIFNIDPKIKHVFVDGFNYMKRKLNYGNNSNTTLEIIVFSSI